MSISVQFSKQDQSRFMKDLKQWRKSMNLTRDEALDEVAHEIRFNAQKNIDNNGTTDRGLLKNSITVNKTFSGGRRIGTETGYGLYVEKGRPPGKMPPVKLLTGKNEPLDDWVRRKGLGGTFSIKTRRRTGSKATRQNQDEQMAFFIARKIGKKGVPPRPFLLPAFNDEKRRIVKELQKQMKRSR